MIENPLSRRFPLLAFARNNLTRAKARTALAIAGITIGVIAITSVGMFGEAYFESFRQDFDDQIKYVGVTPSEDADFDKLDRDHVERIEQETEYPVITVQQQQAQASVGEQTEGITLKSVSHPQEFATAEEGEIPDTWRTGAAVGASVAEELDVHAGDSIVVDGTQYRVVAVLEEDERFPLISTENSVFLPEEQSPMDGYNSVFVQTDGPQTAFQTSDDLEGSLNAGREDDFSVVDAEQAIENFNQQSAQLQVFLFAIGGISMLVAGVSILNVMLMSTIERREEIGVLRAVGYHRLDVLRLMLNEAMLIGIIGAVLGVVISVALGLLINGQFLGDPLAFTRTALSYVGLGFVFGTVATFISGLYPAWKAANSRPVEALRD